MVYFIICGDEMKKIFFLFAFLFSFSSLTLTNYFKLQEITPDEKAIKKSENYKIEGKTFKFQSTRVKIEVEPLLIKDISSYFKSKGLENPFEDVPEGFNYIFFRARIENLSKDVALDFSPSMVILNDMVSKDDSTVYEMFYDKKNGEKYLDILGKTIFFKPLSLPPKMWIERLLFFEYEDIVSTKRFLLTFSDLTQGREIFEVSFPFRAKFIKEKDNGQNS
jgi:hypothetical protein